MLRVTWEWLGLDPALDVANTIAVENGIEVDLLAPPGEYERWTGVAANSPALFPDGAAAISAERKRLLELRDPIRQVLAATAAGKPLPGGAVAELNRVSRAAPAWRELEPNGEMRERAHGSPADRLLATYARSAMEIASEGAARLRRCPAPSCGMFYRPTRSDQHWCSKQCGTRARVARHYSAGRRRQS
jgi:predicted RNA-binding Zn ribbon-like protein